MYRYIYMVLRRVIKWAAEGCCSYIQIELSTRACTVADWVGLRGKKKKKRLIDQAIFIKYSCGNAL